MINFATIKFETEWPQITAFVVVLLFIGFIFGGAFGVYREGKNRDKRWRDG